MLGIPEQPPMAIRLDSMLHLPPGGAERLKRMVERKASEALTVRLRIDPLSQPVFDDALDKGDMSQVHMLAELDEAARDVLLVVRERKPADASRRRGQRRIGAITYPHPLTIAIDEESGGIVIRSLPDTHLFH